MSQRLQLYAKNFGVRLGEAGYTEEDINERFQKMLLKASRQQNPLNEKEGDSY